MITKAFLFDILSNFWLDSEPVSCEPHGCGHVNKTYLAITETGHRYMLQMIGPAFKDVHALQDNIAAVTEHLHKKTPEKHGALTLIPTTEGEDHYHDPDGHTWRIYEFIEDGICLESAKSPEDFYQAAIAFGTFQQLLNDFPADTLHETIPLFHNTPNRYKQLREVLERDPLGRAKEVEAEIAFAMAREEKAGQLVAMLEAGELPLRVTHNDTKLNNVMFRASDRTPLCVVDLDTTMPGLSAYDFGDAIRFGASTAAEDEKDLSKVWMDLELFRLFTKGYLEACPGLTDKEKEVLPLAAFTMTLECGIRFLADYIDGDNYFSIHYTEQNLDRCHTQFKLVADMETKWNEMAAIVANEGNA